jgi:hypothetical protein
VFWVMLLLFIGFLAALKLIRSTAKDDMQDPRTVFDSNSDGTTDTVANAVPAAATQGYAITKTVSVDSAGTRTVSNTGLAADGALALITRSVTSADGKFSTVLLNLDGMNDANGYTSTDLKKVHTLANTGGGARTDYFDEVGAGTMSEAANDNLEKIVGLNVSRMRAARLARGFVTKC